MCFKVDIIKNIGDNWLIADFGTDDDGEHYIVTTDNVHASDAWNITSGAKEDAIIVCELLNQHYRRMRTDHYYRKGFNQLIIELHNNIKLKDAKEDTPHNEPSGEGRDE